MVQVQVKCASLQRRFFRRRFWKDNNFSVAYDAKYCCIKVPRVIFAGKIKEHAALCIIFLSL